MAGVNKVILVGNLGQDPKTHTFGDGQQVTNASIATSETWKDKQTGEKKEKTEWHNVVFRDRGNYQLGAIAAKYLTKGSKIYVEGKLVTRKWQDQNGQDKYTTEIHVDEMQMLDSKGAGQQPAAATPQSSSAQHTPPPPAPGQSFDDDIPF